MSHSGRANFRSRINLNDTAIAAGGLPLPLHWLSLTPHSVSFSQNKLSSTIDATKPSFVLETPEIPMNDLTGSDDLAMLP